MSKYTVDYFLNKFDVIPEEKWATGVYFNGLDKCCAMGHCGVRFVNNFDPNPLKQKYPYYQHKKETKEAKALESLFECHFDNQIYVPYINDGDAYGDIRTSDLGNSPKERVMNALMLIKAGVK